MHSHNRIWLSSFMFSSSSGLTMLCYGPFGKQDEIGEANGVHPLVRLLRSSKEYIVIAALETIRLLFKHVKLMSFFCTLKVTSRCVWRSFALPMSAIWIYQISQRQFHKNKIFNGADVHPLELKGKKRKTNKKRKMTLKQSNRSVT